jgi:hypothetical protein
LPVRQGGGLEEQPHDILLQILGDNERPSEGLAKMKRLNVKLYGLY